MIFTADHYHLLTPATRGREDLSSLAARAEALVLGVFTVAQGSTYGADGMTIKLRGYDAESMDAALEEQLVQAIALTAEHLASAPPEGVASVSRGERSVTYTRRALVPREAVALLRRFDTREPLYRV